MSNVDTLINHLEANARDELAAQERFLELLDRQERAIVKACTADVARHGEELETESANASRRAGSRQRILKAISTTWNVPVSAMTLGSIAERAGARGRTLAELRKELRLKASEVIRKNRRVASVARMHQQVMREVIDMVFADENGGPLSENVPGNLIDAEA